MTVQPVPEQYKPENQDPAVAHSLDEMTGEKTAYEGFELPKEDDESDEDEESEDGKSSARKKRTKARELGTFVKPQDRETASAEADKNDEKS